MSAPGGTPETGEVWDAAWLEFHDTWRPRLRVFLTSVCARDPDPLDDILRASLLRHRRQWSTLDDPDYAHIELFAIVLDEVRTALGERSPTPRRSETVVLHDLLELPVGEIAVIQRSSEQLVRMHLALGHRDHDHAGGFTVPEEEAPDVDHGVELLHTAYQGLDQPLPVAEDDDPEGDYALGLVCEQRGDLRGAALCFQRATAHDFEDAADRFESLLAHLRLPSRGRQPRHALVEPEPPLDQDRLAIEALVLTSEEGQAAADSLPAEQRAICGLCRESRAVAEVAARLNLPLDVTRSHVGDLAVGGLVVVHETAGSAGPAADLLARVLAGLRVD